MRAARVKILYMGMFSYLCMWILLLMSAGAQAGNVMWLYNSSMKSKNINNFSMIKLPDAMDEHIACNFIKKCPDFSWNYPDGTEVNQCGDCKQLWLMIDSKNHTDGLYTCRCSSDQYSVIAVLGIYNDTAFNKITGPDVSEITLLKDSPIDKDPQFNVSLNFTFIVREGPPTIVECTRPENVKVPQKNIMKKVVENGTATLVTVMIITESHPSGDYVCNVSTNRVDYSCNDNGTCSIATNGTVNTTLTVADTPSDLSLVRLNTGLAHMNLSWTGSSSMYWVHIKRSSDEEVLGIVETSNTYIVPNNTDHNAKSDETYIFTVRGAGDLSNNKLLSAKSNSINITLTTPSIDMFNYVITAPNVTLNWTISDFIPSNGYKGKLTCGNNNEECSKDRSYTVTAYNSSLTVILDDGDYITDDCLLTLYGLYGNDEFNLTTEKIEAQEIPPLNNVTIQDITHLSLTLSWQWNHCLPPLITGYYITYTNITDTYTINVTDPCNTTYNITGLTPNTAYYIIIMGYSDKMGMGVPSSQLSASTLESVPGPVSNLTSYASDVDEITVQWNEPIYPNGYITAYELLYGANGSDVKMMIATESVIIITELQHNQTYCIHVAANTSVGRGEAASTMATTKNIKAVVILQVTRNESGIFITWEQIQSKALMWYNVSYRSIDNPDDEGYEEFNNTVTQATIDVMSAEDTYVVGVEAVYEIMGKIFVSEAKDPRTVEPWTTTATRNGYTVSSYSPSSTERPTGNNGHVIFDLMQYLYVIVSGAMILFLLLIAATIVCMSAILIYVRRRKRKLRLSNNSLIPIESLYTVKVTILDDEEVETEKTVAPVDNEGVTRLYSLTQNTSVLVKDFCDFVSNGHLYSEEGFKNQFENVLINGDDYHSSTISSGKTNSSLNRFLNISVYDDNRVILDPLENEPECQHDYINASYIKGYTSAYSYIATQGPIDATIVDFWRLIWQENSHVIVMVTNLVEDGRHKCAQYWPNSQGTSEHHGPFNITLVDEQIFVDYTVRRLTLNKAGESKSSTTAREITQYHFTSWPDHGVPQYSNSMMNFHRHVKNNTANDGPITVHCSAGVGRTGTFITIDIALQQIEHEGVINIPGIINGLRHQRTRMVQTVDQYVFLHDAMLEYLIFGSTQINVTDLRIYVNRMDDVNTTTEQNEFQRQFKVISKVTPTPGNVPTNAALDNVDRNRSMEYLPPDKYRIFLRDETCNYIHASVISGYKKSKSFIIAENPMESTCCNFWRMINDLEVNVVIMLGNTEENNMSVCHTYWPTESSCSTFGDLGVTLVNETTDDGFIERVLRLKQRENSRIVTQYQITNWEPNGEIEDVTTVTGIFEKVWKIQRSSKLGSRPIVVHCSDTVTRSGIFCACATVIEKCKAEKVVEVFQVVKAQRLQKPGSVPSYQNYKLIFNIVLAYLDSFELYSNFEAP